ncbi:ABC-type multidrug transport system fused ATPase/permease subunit [Streptacidiphilus sp. MAP12-16]|uniref:ABC transporter ATP-binding protein n=1 Tax=Streptacidiphilus sp. MAP12-16 TaxID=3156300 RepID=UPI0035166037
MTRTRTRNGTRTRTGIRTSAAGLGSSGRRSRHVWADLLLRSWRLDRRNSLIVLLFMLADSAALVLSGYGLRSLVNSALSADGRGTLLSACATGTAYSVMLLIGRVQMEIRLDLADRVGMYQVDAEIQRLVSGLDTIEHLERSEYLDRINRLRGKGQLMCESGWAVLDAAANGLRVLVTLGLLATVQPALLLLAVLAVPALLLNGVGQRVVTRAAEQASGDDRAERELFELTTRSGPAKELRVLGSGDGVDRLADEAWQRSSRRMIEAYWRSALLGGAGWGTFVLGLAAVLGVVIGMVADGSRSIGDVVLVVAMATTLRAQFERVAWSLSRLQAGMVAVEPFLWLHAYAAPDTPLDGAPVAATTLPTRLEQGIALEEVSFAYPGTDREVLRGVTVALPAGAMVAVVGEHGSGKTTLVKLLCKLYEPTSGHIAVDGAPLSGLDAAAWRTLCSGAFQDFGRYAVTLGEAVGIGEPAFMGDDERVLAALAEAEAGPMLAGLPEGLETPLGPSGTDLSEGQWQRVALARAAMRREPLLFVLDEPTASLDPPTEHAVFTRHAEHARALGAATGAVTVVVTHRFTTVRMADLILVLRDGRLTESGTHQSLLALGGTYADLYQLQEAAYAATPS